MTPLIASGLHAIHLGILRCASVLTPQGERAEWWREWRSELWHVRKACASTGTNPWHAEREVGAFCIGAFQDALCLRRHAWQSGPPFAAMRGSVAESILSLVCVLAVSYGLSVLLPGVRLESHPSLYRLDPGLILIQDSLHSNDAAATISIEQFKKWKARRQRYFDAIAFYRINRETVTGATHGRRTGLVVAHASENLFSLLGLPVRFAVHSARDKMPGVILSDALWKRDFGGDAGIVGQVVRVGRRDARIAGIAVFGVWRLPGRVDAWFLEPDTDIRSGSIGYVVAHLTSRGQSEMLGERVQIGIYNSDDQDDDLWGVSLAERTQGPWTLYLFTIFISFLCLPAITSVSLGESSFSSHRPSRKMRLCRAALLCAKVALLLPISYYLSLDLAYWNTTSYSVASEYLQMIASFLICLFGMRWVLLDHRRRCPVCLRRVTHPVQVGLASRTFLGWNGTELICMSGHTMLHVPGLPTSWFSSQRWLYLDTSWQFLFSCSD
jgi:hypothetical protein